MELRLVLLDRQYMFPSENPTYARLLSCLNASLGVSRCKRPLLRLSRPGVALRCCNALIACGVVGLLLSARETCNGRRLLGVRDRLGGCAAFSSGKGGAPFEARLRGVDGFLMIAASCRS